MNVKKLIHNKYYHTDSLYLNNVSYRFIFFNKEKTTDINDEYKLILYGFKNDGEAISHLYVDTHSFNEISLEEFCRYMPSKDKKIFLRKQKINTLLKQN